MNIGEERRNIKTDRKFKPLFLVSKGLPRSRAPSGVPAVSDADERKSRLLGTEQAVPGNNLVEAPWSEESQVDERSEVMQAGGQFPAEQSVFEFLDMLEVSDWLADRRRQNIEDAARRIGSEERGVESKEEGYASNGLEQDDEAEDSSQLKRQSAASEDRHLDSEDEVFRAVISKAKPVRIKATYVAKTFVPAAELIGSKPAGDAHVPFT